MLGRALDKKSRTVNIEPVRETLIRAPVANEPGSGRAEPGATPGKEALVRPAALCPSPPALGDIAGNDSRDDVRTKTGGRATDLGEGVRGLAAWTPGAPTWLRSN